MKMVQPSCVGCVKRSLALFSTSTTHQFPRMHQTKPLESVNIFEPDNLSKWERAKWELGFLGKLAQSNTKLAAASYNLYICCTDFVDFSQFVKDFDMPDNFTRWFLVTTLHVWLVTVKLAQMGREGYLMKEHIYTSMWQNIEERLKTFKELQGSQKKKEIQTLYTHSVMLYLYMDEGIIGSDKALANALWIMLFDQDKNCDPEKLALMVDYVRKQVHYHDQLSPYPILNPGYISFMPIQGDRVDKEKTDAEMNELVTRSFRT